MHQKEHPITLSYYPKAILHIDCDAFFTSCEQAKDPRLKKRPVITGKERGIVSCASYEAKARGVERGMPLFQAKKLCPDCVILPSDYELYSIISTRMFSIVRNFTPTVEEYSIDEAFCDLTGLRRIYRTSYPAIASKIKETIEDQLDITVSVGLSLTKTLAKMCSKYKKPSGFTALPGYMLHKFLKKIPLRAVCGFGPNTVALLNKCGAVSVLDYIKRPLEWAEKLLGKIGKELWHELRGTSVYELAAEPKEKYLSISKTKTFSPPSSNRDFAMAKLIRNLEAAFIKLRRHKLSARKVTVYLRKQDFNDAAGEAKMDRHTYSTFDFVKPVKELFNLLYEEGASYRATGIILSDLVDEGVDCRTLFDDSIKIEKMEKLSKVIDEVNKIYGKHTLYLGASHLVEDETAKRHRRNDTAWRKKNLLKGETFRKRVNIPLLKI